MYFLEYWFDMGCVIGRINVFVIAAHGYDIHIAIGIVQTESSVSVFGMPCSTKVKPVIERQAVVI